MVGVDQIEGGLQSFALVRVERSLLLLRRLAAELGPGCLGGGLLEKHGKERCELLAERGEGRRGTKRDEHGQRGVFVRRESGQSPTNMSVRIIIRLHDEPLNVCLYSESSGLPSRRKVRYTTNVHLVGHTVLPLRLAVHEPLLPLGERPQRLQPLGMLHLCAHVAVEHEGVDHAGLLHGQLPPDVEDAEETYGVEISGDGGR